jgi:chromosome segregation ATPase
MNTLTPIEITAVKNWQRKEAPSVRKAAEMIGTDHPTFLKWLKGGRINPFQRKRLWDFTRSFSEAAIRLKELGSTTLTTDSTIKRITTTISWFDDEIKEWQEEVNRLQPKYDRRRTLGIHGIEWMTKKIAALSKQINDAQHAKRHPELILKLKNELHGIDLQVLPDSPDIKKLKAHRAERWENVVETLKLQLEYRSQNLQTTNDKLQQAELTIESQASEIKSLREELAKLPVLPRRRAGGRDGVKPR